MRLRVAKKVLRRQKACESLAAFDGRELTWETLGDRPRPYSRRTLALAHARTDRARRLARYRWRLVNKKALEATAAARIAATAAPARQIYGYLAGLLGVLLTDIDRAGIDIFEQSGL